MPIIPKMSQWIRLREPMDYLLTRLDAPRGHPTSSAMLRDNADNRTIQSIASSRKLKQAKWLGCTRQRPFSQKHSRCVQKAVSSWPLPGKRCEGGIAFEGPEQQHPARISKHWIHRVYQPPSTWDKEKADIFPGRAGND